MTPGTCRKCRRALPVSAATGRPRRFCSTGCRRAAEYELRRLQRQLEEVEEQARWCRLGWHGRTESQASKYLAEQERLEARLRELLDDADGAD